MTHEKNMMDFLDEIFTRRITDIKDWRAVRFYEIRDKWNLNKSPPKLGDFIPTNEDGEVMEKPDGYEFYIKGEMSWDAGDRCKEYQSALDRVIWKGWYWENRALTDHNIHIFIGNFDTYEKLINSRKEVKLERIQKK